MAACSLAPDYVRPEAPIPENAGLLVDQGPSLPAWEDYLPETRLRKLILTALDKNRDLRVAGLKILEARAEFGMARSERFPMLEGMASETASGGARLMTNQTYELALSLPAFEIDYLGRLNDLSRAALERYLGTIEAGRYTRLTLVASVAGAYLDNRLAIERVRLTERNLKSFRDSRSFVEERLRSGQADLLELEQAKGMVAFAEAQLATRKAELVKTENALAFWIGDFGALELPEATPLMKWPKLTLPEGIRSGILLGRPDIMEAEHALLAANANIGAARAAFFPSINLTGSLGVMSMELSSLLGGNNSVWSFGPRVTIPIFNAGRNRANLDLAEVRKDMAVAEYEKAIQNAFREVAEGLGMRGRLAERLKAQSNYLATQRRVLELAENRYQNGVISYLEVLEAQRNVLEAELELLEIKREQIFNDISLYSAMGGGFPEEDEDLATPAAKP
jgi:Cu(I)/Ag(I) efflux system outer membrane protein